MTTATHERKPTHDEVRAEYEAEQRAAASKQFGEGVKPGTPEAEMYDRLVAKRAEGNYGDANMMHSIDYTDVIEPMLRLFIRSNRHYWKSRKMGSGWVIQRNGLWIRSNGLTETQRDVANALKDAGKVMKSEMQIRDAAFKNWPRTDEATHAKYDASTKFMRRSIKSYSSMMTHARSLLVMESDWFLGLALEWILTVCDRRGEIPESITVADLKRLHQKAEYPSGLSFDEDIREELEELGIVRNHSNIFKVHLGDQDVRDALVERLAELRRS